MLTRCHTTMPKYLFLLILVCAFIISFNSAKAQKRPRARHDHHVRMLSKLRNQMDRVLLRQQTDHILLHNMISEMESLKAKGPSVGTENLKEISKKLTELKDILKEAFKGQEETGGFLALHEELNVLRSELHSLKMVHKNDYPKMDTEAVQWAKETFESLQKEVESLQNAFNVTVAIHEKQEIAIQLATIAKDTAALQSTLSTLQRNITEERLRSDETKRDAVDTAFGLRRNDNQISLLKTEVASLNEDFIDLLRSFPEGYFAGKHDGKVIVEKEISPKYQALDSKVSVLQKKLRDLTTEVARCDAKMEDLRSSKAVNDASLSELKAQVSLDSEGIKEIKESSIDLISALDVLEATLDAERERFVGEMAKLDNMAATCSEDNREIRSEVKILSKSVENMQNDISSLNSDVESANFNIADIKGDILNQEFLDLAASSHLESLMKSFSKVVNKLYTRKDLRHSAKVELQELKEKISKFINFV